MSLATLWAFFLPSVQHSIYFYRENNKQDGITGAENPTAATKESGNGENYAIR
jgi:hypothetical protein